MVSLSPCDYCIERKLRSLVSLQTPSDLKTERHLLASVPPPPSSAHHDCVLSGNARHDRPGPPSNGGEVIQGEGHSHANLNRPDDIKMNLCRNRTCNTYVCPPCFESWTCL